MEKADLLNYLQQEHQRWEDFLAKIGPARMEQEGVNGEWSMKDIVAHLAGWNRWLVDRLQAVQRNEAEPPPPWPADRQSEDEINEWIYESHRGRSLQEVLDETQQQYQQLLAIIKALPDDVHIEEVQYIRPFYFVWVDDKRFAVGEFFDHFRDDHEPDIRAWMMREGIGSTDA